MIYNSNKLEKEELQNIASTIRKYEETEQKKITKVAFYNDIQRENTFLNYPNNSFTIKSICTSYARKDSVQYYLNEDLTEVNQNEELTEYFSMKNWTSFSEEQLIFEDDTVHICVY